MSEDIDNEVDVDDGSLALAAGGIKMMNSPTDPPPSYNYSQNATIYH
ncbi:hypothetical protein [Aurantimicrobium minutum]|nr:hypothetical protein [Aurantimicrobium minutum]MDH6423407.1 hypothetical protein [Aurantimicrobium minutum]